jgi:hypothetical protein
MEWTCSLAEEIKNAQRNVAITRKETGDRPKQHGLGFSPHPVTRFHTFAGCPCNLLHGWVKWKAYIFLTALSYFAIDAVAFNAWPPVLSQCQDSSGKKKKKISWVRAYPLMHRLLHLSDPKAFPSGSLSGPMTWQSQGAKPGEYGGWGRV